MIFSLAINSRLGKIKVPVRSKVGILLKRIQYYKTAIDQESHTSLDLFSITYGATNVAYLWIPLLCFKEYIN